MLVALKAAVPQPRFSLAPQRWLVLLPAWTSAALWGAATVVGYALCWRAQRGDARSIAGFLLATGPLLLAAAPGACWARRLQGLRPLATAVAIAFLVYVWILPAAAALLLVGLLATTAIWVWIELARFPRVQRRVARAILAGLILGALIPSLRQCADELPIVLNHQRREEFLVERLGCHHAALVANELVHPGDLLLSEDPHPYWFHCRVRPARLMNLPLVAAAAQD